MRGRVREAIQTPHGRRVVARRHWYGLPTLPKYAAAVRAHEWGTADEREGLYVLLGRLPVAVVRECVVPFLRTSRTPYSSINAARDALYWAMHRQYYKEAKEAARTDSRAPITVAHRDAATGRTFTWRPRWAKAPYWEAYL